MKTYYIIEKKKNLLFWENYGTYLTYEQAQEGLVYWNVEGGVWRIVKETREICCVVGEENA